MLWAFLLMEIDIYEEPRYTGVNKDIPLPSNINTDKQAILDILHNHFLLAQIFWPDDDIILQSQYLVQLCLLSKPEYFII